MNVRRTGPLWLVIAVAGCKHRAAESSTEVALVDANASAEHAIAARCVPLSGEAFVLGDRGAPPRRAPSPIAAEDPSSTNATTADDLVPFAAEVGDGVTWAGGFAVGALHRAGGVLAHAVVTLDARGSGGRLIGLGPARGEAEPARIAAHGHTLVAGLLEPQGEGRALRLAKIDEGNVTWGGTVHEKAGESQAFDLALGDQKGVVVWDEDGPEQSSIQVATFDVGSANALTAPRTISERRADCESPRLTPRAGGFWLTYIARRGSDEDSDARDLAEDIGYRWIEAVALDANGSPTGPARSVSTRDGHVLVFDVAQGPEDGAVVVWRDDDTPSGSAGGEVMLAVVRAARIDPPSVLASADVGAGVPSLVGGWLAVLDSADTTRIAPISEAGELRGALQGEPAIASGEPLAAGPEGLLVARSSGASVRLSVVRCLASPP